MRKYLAGVVVGIILVTAGAAFAIRSGAVNGDVIEGPVADGSAVLGNPVLMGGQDGTNVQSLSVNTSGQLLVNLAGASTSTAYGEVLVLTAATAVPTTILTGRRSVFVQNNGPNEIVCATNTSVSLTNGVTLAANGGNITLDCGTPCAMNCIAQTANQVSGAATNFIEIN